MKLRILLSEECHRNCSGCCNKDWDIPNLPPCTTDQLYQASEVILTGGEPMLFPDLVVEAAKRVPRGTPVFIYTAKVDDYTALEKALPWIDGLTVTLHDTADTDPFIKFARSNVLYETRKRHGKVVFPGWQLGSFSLRLNIFKGVKGVEDVIEEFSHTQYRVGWNIKKDITWIKNCPLPKDEVFVRWDKERNNV